MKKILLFCIILGAALPAMSQKVTNESSLLLGYQRYFKDTMSSLGMINVGYTLFSEHESLYRFTRRSRFTASALLNPGKKQYGLQVSGSYSYLLAVGFSANVTREIPFVEKNWALRLSPFVGLDFWFLSFHIGYNLTSYAFPALAEPVLTTKPWNYTLNAYIPLKRNKNMYR